MSVVTRLLNRAIHWNNNSPATVFAIGIARYGSKSSTSYNSVSNLYEIRRRAMMKRGKNRARGPAAPPAPVIKPQPFEHYLVLDFEATCERNIRLRPQEIIEFPVLKVNGKTFEVEAEFHRYVQPKINKQLTDFCIELTGIVQDMVDGQPHIEEVLKEFDQWRSDHNLTFQNSAFVTCGDWDLKTMLPSQCEYFDMECSEYFNQWINIKKVYSSVTGTFPKGMMDMLNMLRIQHEGRHHSGIVD
ncbi:ERI1 exoribonuclease 3-like isoform X2 [Tubulanus polymorphus]|uniref:ERI1 exoribonuclease 3-like isoform X2 n=1 Tax=Tubulanus polymorphus TaxID=672921 RepID=UPI003DA3031D